jgi:transposase
MKCGRKLKPLQLTTKEYEKLVKFKDDPKLSLRQRRRARIILACATGASNTEVARKNKTNIITVGKWRKRFLDQRLGGLEDEVRSGRPANEWSTQPIDLTAEESKELKQLTARRTTSQALALRARIILACAEGESNCLVAKREGIRQETVRKWRRRFAQHRLDGLCDEVKPGAPRKCTDGDVERVIVKTLESTPRDATHWSTRSLAKEVGLSRETVGRIWRAFGLQPHRVETFKLSSDPYLIEKVRDIVGLYLHPPEKAVVLCVDEKSQIQALDRTEPILPLRPGLPESRTHDYKRNGTTSLFAALNYVTGEVIGKCYRRHRTVEFRKFLDQVEKNVPQEQDIHIILDNYGTHKTALIHKWLLKRPRFHLHFTPTSSSWLNLVERWFAELTRKRIRRGSFDSAKELEKSIYAYLDAYNENAKPFVWMKTADEILENIKKHCERISVSPH